MHARWYPLALFLAAVADASQENPRAEPDVHRPRLVRWVPAQYPSALRGGMPVVMGLIMLEVELDGEGRPIDIKVMSGIPLLDRAAIDAVRQWRYEPTIVAGRRQRVVVEEVVDLFPSEGLRLDYFVKMLNDSKRSKPYRLFALKRLAEIGLPKKHVLQALEKASNDSDEDIRDRSIQLLEALAKRGDATPPP